LSIALNLKAAERHLPYGIICPCQLIWDKLTLTLHSSGKCWDRGTLRLTVNFDLQLWNLDADRQTKA